ncbi:hypothetical protein WJX82_008263 [Trebouxia sp. C0006]
MLHVDRVHSSCARWRHMAQGSGDQKGSRPEEPDSSYGFITRSTALACSGLVPVAAAAALSEFPAAAAQRMLINIRPYGPEETAAAFQAFLSLLATWMGALPMPLDWGKDWQEWPIGCSAGGAYGTSASHD